MKKQFLHTVLMTIIVGAFSCAHACDQFIDHLQQDLSQGKKLTLSRAELEDYVAHFPEMKPLVPAELYDKSLCSHDYDYEKLTIMCVFEDEVIYEAHSGGYPFMDGRMSRDFLQGYMSYKKSYASPLKLSLEKQSPLEQEIANLRALPTSRLNNLKIAKLEQQLKEELSKK